MDTRITRIGRIDHGFFGAYTKESVIYPPNPRYPRVH